MERIILGDKLSCNVYGFIKWKSTTDGVIKCQSYDADKCRVFLDLNGAFDKARGEVILYELGSLRVSEKILQWIRDYLCGKSVYVWYQGCVSYKSKF